MVFTKLKRLVRCLKGERQWSPVFKFGCMGSEVTVLSDADRAGNEETRKSSSAGVALLGRHILTAYTRKQKIVARNSAEATLYAATLTFSDAKGIESMMLGLGFAMKPVLIIDAKATEHILHRHGIRRMKHIDVACLWLQDEVKSERLRVRRVKSEDNLADLGTRELSNKIIRRHATSMVYFDDQDSLESGGVMGLWIDESAWTAQSSQSSSAQKKRLAESVGGHTKQQQQQQRQRQQKKGLIRQERIGDLDSTTLNKVSPGRVQVC